MAGERSGSGKLPRLFATYSAEKGRRAQEGTDLSGAGLVVESTGYRPQPRWFEDDRSALCIVGNPILGDRIDLEGVWKGLRETNSGRRFLRSLNGEFLLLLVDKQSRNLRVFNDRFASIPFYYVAGKEGLIGSVFYNHLWLWLQERGPIEPNVSAIFEFFWLQRVLGTKTYDTGSTFLPSASCLTFDGRTASVDRYWTPSFEKTSASLPDVTRDLGERLRRSVKRKTSDGDETTGYGIFLSGGTDSRTVLAAFERPPVCFTLAVSENNELRVAREVAGVSGAEHVYIPIDADPYTETLDDMVRIGGGMYAFDNALFLGREEAVAERADVVFHGHGVDYMFQGMYVPTAPLHVAGVRSQFARLRQLEDDFTSDYLWNIPHRTKGMDVLTFMKQGRRHEVYESLRASVEQIVEEGRDFCETPYDTWEYMIIHSLSRHYSHPNMTSMSTCAEQRCATFDNDVFDLYLSLPTRYKIDGAVARGTLSYLSPETAKIRTGNTNIRADYSPLQRQLYWILDKSLVKTGLRSRTRFYAPAEERTWPDRNRLYARHPAMRQAALDVSRSEALAALDFLDMDALARQVPAWIDDPSRDAGAFLTYLVTVDRFLRQ